MQLHDILQLRTSVILPEAISDGGLAPTTDTSLFLTTYRGGSHLPSDIILIEKQACEENADIFFFTGLFSHSNVDPILFSLLKTKFLMSIHSKNCHLI